jgi:hypothetical protein
MAGCPCEDDLVVNKSHKKHNEKLANFGRKEGTEAENRTANHDIECASWQQWLLFIRAEAWTYIFVVMPKFNLTLPIRFSSASRCRNVTFKQLA